MLQYFYFARWDQAYDVLVAGNPPMFVRLMALNALFLAIYALRKASGARPMPVFVGFLVQLAVLGANTIVLHQQEVQNYVMSIVNRF